MFEGLSRGDPLGLVETEKFLEQVNPLAGHDTVRRRVTRVGSGSQTFTDLGQVWSLDDLTERNSPLVPGTVESEGVILLSQKTSSTHFFAAA